MKLDICRLDSNRNFSEKEISWLISAIESFSANITESKISSYGGRIKNSSDAFSFYALPAFDKKSDYPRNFQFSENDLLAKNQMEKGNSNPAALACACRINGLLDDYDQFFGLTPLAEKLLATKKISASEYAFILLSKQWICLENEYKEPFLQVAWKLINSKKDHFLETLNVSDGEWSKNIFSYITGNKAGEKDKITPERSDIIRNTLLLSGLIVLDNGELKVPDNAVDIWNDFCQKASEISKPQIGTSNYETDRLYYRYVGSVTQGGIFDILKVGNASIYSALYPNLVEFFVPNAKNKKTLHVKPDSYVKTQEQIIFYGVPGSGKSTKLKEKLSLLKIPQARTKRVVFHPEYSSADFIGQILPETDEKENVFYRFKEGPFTEILSKAYADPNNSYALVIEEINRGNAAAIFGEIFQLLDRKGKKKDPESIYGEGWSDYYISNKYIKTSIGLGQEEDVRLPPNLSLFATMNTSDQNVYTLDNAFQRRWNMQLVPNTLKPEDPQYKIRIEGTNVSWGKFRDVVNKQIVAVAAETGLSSLEDKRLGSWFVKADDENTVSKELFSNKVLKYLWDDAFKMSKDSLFSDCAEKTFEDIVETFSKSGFSVFIPEFVAKLGQ